MLDVFILTTSSPNKDSQKTIKSFNSDSCVFHNVNCIDIINTIEKQHDWYFVIYDNEYLSEELQEVIQIYMEKGQESFYTMYRLFLVDNDIAKSKVSVAPRLFKKKVKLLNNCLFPECGFPVDKANHVLDGFILGAD
jgi:hypothetical protein